MAYSDSDDDQTAADIATLSLQDSELNKLQDYIEASSDDVQLIQQSSKVRYKKSQNERNEYHEVPVEKMHQLIEDAVKTYSRDFCLFLIGIIKSRTMPQNSIDSLIQQPLCEKNGVSVQVTFSVDIKQHLDSLLHDKYEQQPSYNITINVTARPRPTEHINIYRVTDVQTLLALVVVLKCYPEGWWDNFFWDAWLAVTIQLNLLETNNEPFPCLWMKDVFRAEKLVETPERVRCLIMGQDPVGRGDASYLRKATGIAFHKIGDRNPSILGMRQKYGLDCSGEKPIQHCKDGKLLVNMIRCIPLGAWSMNNNPFYDAWFVYSLKLANYFGENNKPVVVTCNRNYSPSLMKYILQVNPQAERVQHPGYDVEQVDKETFEELIVYDPNLPQF